MSNIIKGILYNKDGTVDYMFDDDALNEIIKPFINRGGTPMREILFRGQTRRKGEKVRLDGTPVESNWVYGGVMQGEGDYSIIYQTEPEFHKYPVYSDTLGQYTGLTDKNGIKIFEGDIIVDEYNEYQGEVKSRSHINEMYVKYIDNGLIKHIPLSEVECDSVCVVGNIYDDKESCNETPTK